MNQKFIITEHVYLDNKIIEYSDGTFLSTKMVEGQILSKECTSLLQAKNFIDKRELKLYEMNVKFVQHYSGRVLVEAHSAAEAKERVLDDWENADTIYDKITFTPDNQVFTTSKAKAISEQEAKGFSYHAIVRAEE